MQLSLDLAKPGGMKDLVPAAESSRPSSSRSQPNPDEIATSVIGVKLARIAIVVAILALREVLSRTGIVNPRLLPSASDTFRRWAICCSAPPCRRISWLREARS